MYHFFLHSTIDDILVNLIGKQKGRLKENFQTAFLFLMMAAHAAGGVFVESEPLPFVGECIVKQQLAACVCAYAHQELERFGRLRGADNAHQG